MVKEIFFFINNSNIISRYHYNQNAMHLNKSRTNQHLLFFLSKFDCWNKAQVSMTTNVYRERSNSDKRKKG